MTQQQIQKQKAKSAQRGEVEVTAGSTASPELSAQVTETLDSIDEALEVKDMDDILTDIDDLLEENAAQFVASFIQEGGE